MLANEVNFFPDALPFLEPCFHNIQGFTERDLANFRRPLRPVSSKKSERIAQLKEVVENNFATGGDGVWVGSLFCTGFQGDLRSFYILSILLLLSYLSFTSGLSFFRLFKLSE